eukprot:g1518.t1
MSEGEKVTFANVRELRIDVVDQDEQLIADLICQEDVARTTLRNSPWMREKSLKISESAFYVEVPCEGQSSVRVDVDDIKRFVEFSGLTEVVLEFIHVMSLMLNDRVVAHDKENGGNDVGSETFGRNYDGILSDILVEGGACLNDITGETSDALVGLIQACRFFRASRLTDLALKLAALMLSAPTDSQWDVDDESAVWNAMTSEEARKVRRMLLELPWYDMPGGKRHRATMHLRQRWEEDILTPVEKDLDRLLRVFDGRSVDEGAKALLRVQGATEKKRGIWESTRVLSDYARALVSKHPPRRRKRPKECDGRREQKKKKKTRSIGSAAGLAIAIG